MVHIDPICRSDEVHMGHCIVMRTDEYQSDKLGPLAQQARLSRRIWSTWHYVR